MQRLKLTWRWFHIVHNRIVESNRNSIERMKVTRRTQYRNQTTQNVTSFRSSFTDTFKKRNALHTLATSRKTKRFGSYDSSDKIIDLSFTRCKIYVIKNAELTAHTSTVINALYEFNMGRTAKLVCLLDVRSGVLSGLEDGEEDEGTGKGSNSREPSRKFERNIIEIVTDGGGISLGLGRSGKESRDGCSLLTFEIGKTIVVSVFSFWALQRDNIKLCGLLSKNTLAWRGSKGGGGCQKAKSDKSGDSLHLQSFDLRNCAECP